MRIIHEVDDEMQCCMSAKPYSANFGMCGFNGFIADITAVNENDVIHIEGNNEYIKKMLQDMLNMIDENEKLFLEDLGEHRPANCPNCKPDEVQPNVLHLVKCPQHVNYKELNKGAEEDAE